MVNVNVFKGSDGILMTGIGTESVEETLASEQIDAYELITVGRVSNVDVRVQSDVKAFYEVGKRYPSELRPGNIDISGTVERAYIDGALLRFLLGIGADLPTPNNNFPQPSFNIVLTLENPLFPGKKNILTIYGVKFMGWDYSLPSEEFEFENASFKALSLSVEEIDE